MNGSQFFHLQWGDLEFAFGVCHYKDGITLRCKAIEELLSAYVILTSYTISKDGLLLGSFSPFFPHISPPTLCHQQQVECLQTVFVAFVEIIGWIEDVAAYLFRQKTM